MREQKEKKMSSGALVNRKTAFLEKKLISSWVGGCFSPRNAGAQREKIERAREENRNKVMRS
jgi:hypothetical protein